MTRCVQYELAACADEVAPAFSQFFFVLSLRFGFSERKRKRDQNHPLESYTLFIQQTDTSSLKILRAKKKKK